MLKVRILAITLALVSLTCFAGAAVSSAETSVKPRKPSLSMKFAQTDVSAGTALSLAYTAKRVPASAKLQVQRKFGQTWRKVKNLTQNSGTVTVPGLAMGAYPYRLAAVEKRKAVAVSKATQVRSYGTVTLDTMRRENSTDLLFDSGSFQVGSSLYTYSYMVHDTTQQVVLAIEDTSCRAMHLTGGTPRSAMRIEVVQDAADFQALDIPVNTVGALDVQLAVGHNVQVQAASSTPASASLGDGTGDCFTPTGHR